MYSLYFNTKKLTVQYAKCKYFWEIIFDSYTFVGTGVLDGPFTAAVKIEKLVYVK